MTIALLATGDEIIHGDTLNTNSHHIAQILSASGLPLGLHLSCSDKESELYDCMKFLAEKHEIIIVTGGLGPTSDDRTRYALERMVSRPLVEFPEVIEHIEARLSKSGIGLSAGNRQQALFPQGARILPNPNGSAVGCFYQQDDRIFILLPGPPRECLPMFSDSVMPLLEHTHHSDKEIIKWRLFGVAESQIAHQIDAALATIDCKTGYRLETPYIECKVRCKKELMETVQHTLEPIIRPHIIANTELKASEQLALTIAKLKVPVTIIDDATGGLLQTLIQNPTNYEWLDFNQSAQTNLQFHLKGLEDFWMQKTGSGETSLSIFYSNGKLSGSETREIPYRSPLVVHYAAEWLSFRIIHLINQLHEGIA